ncbi:MAG: VWA domain-containing protein [Actinomycetota bacterium]|nr:VWA domain-containing protein [Actinomycetota bacterium]
MGFGRHLRSRGLNVGTGRILTFVRAAGVLRPSTRRQLFLAGRTSLVSRPEDFDVYRKAFDEYFGPTLIEETLTALLTAPAPKVRVEDPEGILGEEQETVSFVGETAEEGDDEGEITVRMVASAVERLKQKSFEQLTEEERTACYRLIRKMRVSMPERRSRRLRPAPKGARFDFRRTLRSSLRTEGEPFRRAWRHRRIKPRPLVLVLDVSGSMSTYARALLQFAHAAMRTAPKVEVFAFGTRLTRLTRALRGADPDAALLEASALAQDWEGGTRIGDSLAELLKGHSQAASLRGSIVVLCSDGLDRGDPNVLAAQMLKLTRLAHRVVWVNPLKGSSRYQPLQRGMAAALPHLDVFVPGHNVASLESLAELLDSPAFRR